MKQTNVKAALGIKSGAGVKLSVFSGECGLLTHTTGSNIVCNALMSDLSGGVEVQSDSVLLGALAADMVPTTSGFPVENDEYSLDLPSKGFASITEAIEDIRNGKVG